MLNNSNGTWDPGIIAGVKTDAEELIYTCFFGLHQRSIKPETLMTLYDIQWDPGILRQIAHLQLRFSFVLHVHDPDNFQSGGPYSSGDGVLKSFLFLPRFYMLPLIEFECEVYLVTCAVFLAPSFRVQILRRPTVMSLLLLTMLHLLQDFEVHFTDLCRPMGAGSSKWNHCHRLSLPRPITGIHVLGDKHHFKGREVSCPGFITRVHMDLVQGCRGPEGSVCSMVLISPTLCTEPAWKK